jgi:hypothetical protein
MTWFDLIGTTYFPKTQTQSGFCTKMARFKRAIRDPDWIQMGRRKQLKIN